MKTVLLTGATGYVGGRLLRTLESGQIQLRCLARDPAALSPRIAPTTEVFEGDVVTGHGLDAALQGVDCAYYLVHSMHSGDSFEVNDRAAAENFGEAARRAGVSRIVYLGGLADEDADLSPHLRSRLEVGRILRSSGVPTIELRASVVIGAGSLSFEMIRSLVDHLPVLVTPRWVSIPAQPIGIDDLLAYLLQSLELESQGNAIYEIGGRDQLSYAGLMRTYAKLRGRRRWLVPVPVLSPRLSSLWLGLVTPLYARVGRQLIESIRHPSIVRDPGARSAFSVVPDGIERAIARAIAEEAPPAESEQTRDRPPRLDVRTVRLPISPQFAFESIRRIGGEVGWYGLTGLWKLRGRLDELLGGPGLRRGRRDPRELAIGESLDFWRVDGFEEGRTLVLVAEMRLPGRAWLEFEVRPTPEGCELRQAARFLPDGLRGLLYWYAIYPLHWLVFRSMLRGIARDATARSAAWNCVAPRQRT